MNKQTDHATCAAIGRILRSALRKIRPKKVEILYGAAGVAMTCYRCSDAGAHRRSTMLPFFPHHLARPLAAPAAAAAAAAAVKGAFTSYLADMCVYMSSSQVKQPLMNKDDIRTFSKKR